jgi:hypothetical protein
MVGNVTANMTAAQFVDTPAMSKSTGWDPVD